MNIDAKTTSGMTIGLDLGDKFSFACVLDPDGTVVAELRFRTTRCALRKAMLHHVGARVVLEVGTHSPWVSRELEAMGFEVIVANPRRVRLISRSDSKSDRMDAEHLARLGRVDPKLLSPVRHRGEDAQRDLVLVRARDGLVQARTQFVNQVRGFAKSLGLRIPRCSTERFPRRAAEALDARLPAVEPLLRMVDTLNAEIRGMDRRIESTCDERYPETRALRQVKGVGAITALTFVLTIDDPRRFRRSRAVGSFLGLRPRQRDSGDRSPQLRITKAGDDMVRRLLVTAAHYVLGPFGPDTDLRRFGMRLCGRGGKAAKKRAIVAVARKLAVLLHRLWATGEEYRPLGYRAAA